MVSQTRDLDCGDEKCRPAVWTCALTPMDARARLERAPRKRILNLCFAGGKGLMGVEDMCKSNVKIGCARVYIDFGIRERKFARMPMGNKRVTRRMP